MHKDSAKLTGAQKLHPQTVELCSSENSFYRGLSKYVNSLKSSQGWTNKK